MKQEQQERNTTNRWIKVDPDNLPPAGNYVLTINERGQMSTGYVSTVGVGWMTDLNRAFGGHSLESDAVTHWMPLPPNPGEELPYIDTVDQKSLEAAADKEFRKEYAIGNMEIGEGSKLLPTYEGYVEGFVKGCQIQKARQVGERINEQMNIACDAFAIGHGSGTIQQPYEAALHAYLSERFPLKSEHPTEETKPLASAEAFDNAFEAWITNMKKANPTLTSKEFLKQAAIFGMQFKGNPSIQQISDAWVSVEDKPKRNGYYLCIDPNSPLTNNIEVLRYSAYNDSWYDGADTFHPTHWMPLPKKPI